MGLYRCTNENCDEGGPKGAPFEDASKKPVCPLCGDDGPQELVAVHYLVADPAGPIRTGLGRRRIACAPAGKELPQASGSRDAVTCPACRASGVFALHADANTDQHVRHFEKIAQGKLPTA